MGQTYFCTNPISKIGAQVFTVHTFRGSGKTYQQMGLEMVEELTITVCLAMVSLVYNNVVIEVGIKQGKEILEARVKHRDGHE